MRAYFLVLVSVLATAVPAALASASPAANDGLRGNQTETVVVEASRNNSDYKLGPGDKVRVTVYGEEDLSGEFQIDGTGYVRLPLIGQVRAGGHTAYQLEGDVEDALESGYLKSPRVSIEVTAYRPFYIIGQVNRPGQYPYASNMSALDAVGVAGGFTEHAVESSLFVRHEGETREHEVAADESVKIRPGDVIRVEQTMFWAVASWLSPATSVAVPLAYALKP
jgi:polysaccharide export outer membrane protein